MNSMKMLWQRTVCNVLCCCDERYRIWKRFYIGIGLQLIIICVLDVLHD